MAPLGSKQCRECGALNSVEQKSCIRCEARFPNAALSWGQSLSESLLGRETPMTRLFVAACCVVFLMLSLDSADLSLFGGASRWDKLRWGALSATLGSAEPWRLLSATFVHFGVLHVLLNMMAIVSLGKALEPQLGSARFIITLMGTSLFGFVSSHVWYTYGSAFGGITAGASGGVMGLAGALIGFLYARRNPAYRQIATQVVLYAVLFAVMLPVNNAAHAGGLISGIPLGYMWCKERHPRRKDRLVRFAAAAVVLASFSSIVLSHQSDVWRVQKARELIRRSR